MYLAIPKASCSGYLDVVANAHQKGKQRILLLGTPPPGFCERLQSRLEGELGSVRMCGKAEAAPSIKPIAREILATQDWDLIVTFPDGSLGDVARGLKAGTSVPDVISSGAVAECTVLVAVQKGGTNLLHRLLRSLGYSIVGDGANDSYDTVHRALKKEKRTRRDGSLPFDFMVKHFAGARTALSTHGLRLEPDTTARDLGGDISRSEGPANVPTGPLWHWINNAEPPLIFSFRDPRDVLVSLVHYLLDAPSSNRWLVATGTILRSLPTMERRLDYLIRCAPRFIDLAFRQHLWLLFHPRVCKVTFEELVGSSGGGSSLAQTWAVLRVMDHLKAPGDPEKIARKLFSPEARTFRRGQIGDWRAAFSDTNCKDFSQRFGDILELYGYAFQENCGAAGAGATPVDDAESRWRGYAAPTARGE